MKYSLTPIKRHNLSTPVIKKYKLSQEKPKRFKLINPQYLITIMNSQFYDSSFDNPLTTGFKIDNLNYRCTPEMRNQFVEGIVNDDSRILKVKGKKNFVVVVCKGSNDSNSDVIRYVTFVDERKGEYNAVEEENTPPIKEKKDRLHNVPNKSRVKRKGHGKSRRK